ncbi:N-acetyltransferase family protein [Streptomyces sp. NPDC002643]
MIELQVLTPEDWPRWRELRLAALAQAPYAFGSKLADWQGDGDREQRWRDRLSIPGSRNFIAVLDGRPVGMASGVPGADTGVGELISLWVSEEARGRGVGDHLVRSVVRWAVERAADSLRLTVAPANEHALALYRRHGFEKAEQSGDPLSAGGRELVMVKRL